MRRPEEPEEMRPTVLHLIDSFESGGSERQALQIARLLKESSRFEVCLACLDGNGPLRDDAWKSGFRDIPEYGLSSFHDANFFRQVRRFANHLSDKRIGILQTHCFYTNVFGMTAGWLARVPVRIAARRETNVEWRTPMQKAVQRIAYALSHVIVANSTAVRRTLIEEGIREEKTKVIHNGLDLTRVTAPQGLDRGSKLELFGLPRDENLKYVTMLANLHDRVKGHETFLRAARLVRDRDSNARFVIAGEGRLLEPMREIATFLGLEDDVFFIGRCSDIASLLALSNVCVSSSMSEGFSNSILEYLGAGRPVVATDVGGTAEAVVEGRNGYLVTPGDHEPMGSRILKLLGNSDLASAMGRRGREKVEHEFSCEAQLRCTENLYRRLMTPVPGTRTLRDVPREAE
jgi:glycosyltransferase involved in cell wall biosynthesis